MQKRDLEWKTAPGSICQVIMNKRKLKKENMFV